MHILLELARYLASHQDLTLSPAHYAYHIQRLVKEVTGVEDPFYQVKKVSNRVALKLLQELSQLPTEDPLERAIKLSGAGNAVDFAIAQQLDLEERVKEILNTEPALFEYPLFLERLQKAEKVLIIGDNAGEIVLDRLLVEELIKRGKEVIYAVKGAPILNDALMEDAEEAGLTSLCRVVSNGSDRVGTVLEDCSQEFRRLFQEAHLVISKGQANFETLSKADREIFFLLTVKCLPIERETGGKKGRIFFGTCQGKKNRYTF
ncbi:protein of unknown function DUF89 [Thermocrinis albus DSM 14484]|uniref:Damage-control phosphatase ARMT1-like metal-binding domain-containing protein n=2 Tax=Thermocrinis TaxID=75905 RepID=D3SP87_THEAH|nr:protein of unknown function DUF89 [Thermocrinis albus DSM 14484]